jgi:hypothetical protein
VARAVNGAFASVIDWSSSASASGLQIGERVVSATGGAITITVGFAERAANDSVQ